MERYEQIRQAFLERRQSVAMWGLAVLKTKGMATWVTSWRQYEEGKTKRVLSKPPVTTVSSHLPTNSEEVVRVLASMVWAIEKEAVQ